MSEYDQAFAMGYKAGLQKASETADRAAYEYSSCRVNTVRAAFQSGACTAAWRIRELLKSVT